MMTAKSVTAHGQAVFKSRTPYSVWSHPTPTGVTFAWEESNPAEVSMTMDGIKWVFHRMLLEAAIAEPTKPMPAAVGDGAVKVHRPGLSHVVVDLRSAEGQAAITLLMSFVQTFVTRVIELCPDADAVDYDVDTWVAGLLGGDAS